MFFIGIFGIESREKEIKSFSGVVCPDCGRLTSARLYMSYTYFHVFFIPTFRWNRHYFIKVRCCGAVYEAPEEYAKRLKKEETIDMRLLKKVSGGFGGFDDIYTACRKCGKSYDNSFSYCPYCGSKK